MDQNRDVSDHNDWVDERLSKLNPAGDWKPDTERGIEKFRAGRNPAGTGRKWTAVTAMALAAGMTLLAFPAPRSVAQKVLAPCVSACESFFAGNGPASPNAEGITVGRIAPDFTLRDSSGAKFKLSDYRGKVVLLNFWATWCAPCQIEIPWFMAFERNYASRGFAVVGVSMDDDGWNAVKPFIESRHINYRIALGDDALGQKYGGIDSLPLTVVIDRQGRIADMHLGLAPKDAMESAIVRLLGE